MKPVILALLASTAVVSCADKSDVEKDWGETMARYKMIGVFPIKEDLEPGNVLLDVPPANSSDPQPQIRRLGSLDPDSLIRAIKQQVAFACGSKALNWALPPKLVTNKMPSIQLPTNLSTGRTPRLQLHLRPPRQTISQMSK